MHFSACAVTLVLATFAAALPTSSYTPSPTPSASPNNGSTATNIIRPKAVSQYDVWTGAVRYQTLNGKIFKDGKTTDVTTLLTFEFPEASNGKTCSFQFDLTRDSSAKVSGTGEFDVYISQAPATTSASTWPSGNLRDHHIGRMTAKANAPATWVSGFPIFGQSFPCPAGQVYGGELVGVGSVDSIEWLASAAAGAYISWKE